jgi:hypothetical protein
MGQSLSFGMPMGAEWFCVLPILAFAVGAFVVVVVQSSRRRPPPPSAFPVIPVAPPVGPGRFKVSGVERATRKASVWYCEADSEANARVKAELEGIVVTAVERV